MEELTEARRVKLVELVVAALRGAEIPAPASGESETAFTRRCLAPVMERTLDEIGFPGLLLLGTGAASMISCHLLGEHFYPDLGVGFYGDPVFAIEVKFLRGAQRQNSVATATGQAAIYSERFPDAAVVLIDTGPVASDEDIAGAERLLGRLGIPLIVRRSTRDGLLSPHPAHQ